MGDYPFITNICLTWFFIHTILIPLNLCIGMDDIPISIICILVHDDDNWTCLWMNQITNVRNCYWFNLIIINASNIHMSVWEFIGDSNILTKDIISPPINQLLETCTIVVLHIDKLSVNLTIQFPINIEILTFLCRRFILSIEHRWELLGNYHNFVGVMVFYLFCQRTKRVLVTAIRGFKIYTHNQSLMIFI